MALACLAVPFVIAPLRCAGADASFRSCDRRGENGTATLSYCDELARILISAQEPISRRSDILLRYAGRAGHFRHECSLGVARFLFWAAQGPTTRTRRYASAPARPVPAMVTRICSRDERRGAVAWPWRAIKCFRLCRRGGRRTWKPPSPAVSHGRIWRVAARDAGRMPSSRPFDEVIFDAGAARGVSCHADCCPRRVDSLPIPAPSMPQSLMKTEAGLQCLEGKTLWHFVRPRRSAPC